MYWVQACCNSIRQSKIPGTHIESKHKGVRYPCSQCTYFATQAWVIWRNVLKINMKEWVFLVLNVSILLLEQVISRQGWKKPGFKKKNSPAYINCIYTDIYTVLMSYSILSYNVLFCTPYYTMLYCTINLGLLIVFENDH